MPAMRQIVLDTETTGLSAEGGDRIIEIGCVELLHRKLTGNNKHFYLNPGRDSHEDALKVHGISNEFLRDKPKFAKWPTSCWTTCRAPKSSSTTPRSTWAF
jgi:DNA polymerase-3 subunit epsilon